MPEPAAPVALDDIDKRLIEALQHDGRRPYTQLAQEVGLSEAAVRQRVRRLVEVGVTQIVAVTDPMMLGFRRMAMIGVRVDGDVRAVADRLAGLPEIDYLVIAAGSFDVLVGARLRGRRGPAAPPQRQDPRRARGGEHRHLHLPQDLQGDLHAGEPDEHPTA